MELTVHIQKMRDKSLRDVNIDDLKDITQVIIDKDASVADRLASFVVQIGNPYLFKVGNTPVKVSFASDNAPTFQQSLETIFTRNVG